MTLNTSQQALARARKQTHNVEGTCQLTVRTWFNAPSAGDQDHDGDSDANDGWELEPKSARHIGDRNPPAGKPLYFKNKYKTGPHAFGHRAMSGVKAVFSTDMFNNRYAPTHTSRVVGKTTSEAIAVIERQMNLVYVGWSSTMDGKPIPSGVKPKPKPKPVPKPPVIAKPPVVVLPTYDPVKAVIKAPVHAPAVWNGFTHLDPKRYMNYAAAITHAGKLKGRRKAVDVDGHHSSQGTPYGLHWPTVGKNHLHDPHGKIKATARIDTLTDAQIDGLVGPNGEHPHKMVDLLTLAQRLGVRIEFETKVVFAISVLQALMAVPAVQKLHKAGLLQFKTLAAMAGAVDRLSAVHHSGGVTMLSFTDYKGRGISKRAAFPVVDYTRGAPKWVA